MCQTLVCHKQRMLVITKNQKSDHRVVSSVDAGNKFKGAGVNAHTPRSRKNVKGTHFCTRRPASNSASAADPLTRVGLSLSLSARKVAGCSFVCVHSSMHLALRSVRGCHDLLSHPIFCIRSNLILLAHRTSFSRWMLFTVYRPLPS